MSREQLAMRLISGESFVDNKKLVTGRLNEEDWTKIAAASAASTGPRSSLTTTRPSRWPT